MTNHLTNFLISNAATGDDWKAAEGAIAFARLFRLPVKSRYMSPMEIKAIGDTPAMVIDFNANGSVRAVVCRTPQEYMDIRVGGYLLTEILAENSDNRFSIDRSDLDEPKTVRERLQMEHLSGLTRNQVVSSPSYIDGHIAGYLKTAASTFGEKDSVVSSIEGVEFTYKGHDMIARVIPSRDMPSEYGVIHRYGVAITCKLSMTADGPSIKAAEEFVSAFGRYARHTLEESQREAAHNAKMLLQHELKQLPWWKRIFVKGR